MRAEAQAGFQGFATREKLGQNSSREAGMGQTIFGFDSAWTDNKKAPGALCAIRIDSGTVHFAEPELTNFDRAATLINTAKRHDEFVLVALDQPTIVPNATGGRPVEKVAASVISAIKGGVQPSSRSRQGMFDDAAPVWRFLRTINCLEAPENARAATRGCYLIEVFPALALASIVPLTWSRRAAAKYNPGNRNFSHYDWVLVCRSLEATFQDFGLSDVARWCARAANITAPTKADQDKLDAVICLLVALLYRYGGCGLETALLGDLASGYMITPCSRPVAERLLASAHTRAIKATLLDDPAQPQPPITAPQRLRGPSGKMNLDAPPSSPKKPAPAPQRHLSPPKISSEPPAPGGNTPQPSQAGKTTKLGYVNRNRQRVERRTDLPGNDHNQLVYVLRCSDCAYEYGANGSDIFQRRCPSCQGGAAGLAF